MKKMQSKENIDKIINILNNYYPKAKCGLDYVSPIYLTVALILAAQCTDARVNIVAPKLFEKYKDVYELSKANIADIEEIIKPCGFYKNKAKNISLMSKKVVNDFNGNIPNTMEELLTLNGIGRKSANIILQECFNVSVGIAVDTHVSRTSYRIGFTKNTIPLIQEQELIKKINPKYYSKINHILVWHGRKICDARKPKCEECSINDLCLKNGVK